MHFVFALPSKTLRISTGPFKLAQLNLTNILLAYNNYYKISACFMRPTYYCQKWVQVHAWIHYYLTVTNMIMLHRFNAAVF